jgi:hypothetical protein
MPLVVLTLLLPGMVLAQGAVTVQLDPLGESGVSGTAILTAAGEGTEVGLEVTGLTPGAEARVTMHANTCAMPSASFAPLPGLKADATGRATATGRVLFHNMDVALTVMADGQHVIFVRAGGQAVACGVIPPLWSHPDAPTLPVTGGGALGFTPAITTALGLCALSAGLSLGWRSRSRHRF